MGRWRVEFSALAGFAYEKESSAWPGPNEIAHYRELQNLDVWPVQRHRCRAVQAPERLPQGLRDALGREAVTEADVLDLRYENLAWPTEEMWQAMRDTEGRLGMASLGEDPTTRALEARACELTGLESAALVASTTAATNAALQAVGLRGRHVIVESRSHVYWVENHLAWFSGATPIPVRGDKYGAMPMPDLLSAFDRTCYDVYQDVSVVCLENTHNLCGGTYLSPEYTREVAALAHDHGALLYIDGARIFNAAVAQRIPLSDLTQPADIVVLTLNKSLGAPFGCLLCGSPSLVRDAQTIAKRIGANSLHKGGILAAAAHVALDQSPPLMAEDHRRARELAEALSKLACFTIDLDTVQTNLIRVETTPSGRDAAWWESHLLEHGVAVHVFEPNAFKVATYHSVTDEDIEDAIARFQAAAATVLEPPTKLATQT